MATSYFTYFLGSKGQRVRQHSSTTVKLEMPSQNHESKPMLFLDVSDIISPNDIISFFSFRLLFVCLNACKLSKASCCLCDVTTNSDPRDYNNKTNTDKWWYYLIIYQTIFKLIYNICFVRELEYNYVFMTANVLNTAWYCQKYYVLY